MVLSADKPVFVRVLSWWLLVQSWGTLRFDDHRGLLPRDVVVSDMGFQAKLTRFKVSGSDKHLNFRAVIIHSSACVHRKDWLAVGWRLLLKEAPLERDYLLPATSNNFRGFKTKELRYPTAFVVQIHIISTACYRGLRVFEGSTGHYYTPHSGRNFMPSAAAVLGLAKLSAIYLEACLPKEASGILEQPSTKSCRCKQQLLRPSEVRNLTSLLKLMTLTLLEIS